MIPTRGYCLIEPLEAEEKVEGIYMPDSSKENPPKGKVLKVGKPALLQSGAEFLPEFKEGDIVYHKKFVDNHIKENGKELLLIPFTDILAIIE